MADRISIDVLLKAVDAEIAKLQERRAWLLEQKKMVSRRKPRAVPKPSGEAA